MDNQTDVIKRSVTKADYSESVGGAYFLRIGPWLSNDELPGSLSRLSLTESDKVTITTVDCEAIWGGAISIAITKLASSSFVVKGDIPLRTKRGQELLLSADNNNGFVSYVSKLAQDFFLTNNGCFVEIVRATKSLNSPIIGLIPLDSLRCVRTEDPEHPVVYKDLKGASHALRAGDVIHFADMPSNRASLFGSGKCAAYRSYKTIYKWYAIENYITDKITGRRPLSINLINGLNDRQLQSLLLTAQSEADARGIISYMGSIVATVPGESAPGVATIDLASYPDGFNRKEELDITILTYANNLGLDIQDLQPLTGQSLGSGAQSQMLDEKSKVKGLAAFKQAFIHAHNKWVLPEGTTIEFEEKDWRDKKLKAEYNQITEAYHNNSVVRGIITPPQALQSLVDEEVYPDEFLEFDETPDTTLADDEKPEDQPAEDVENEPEDDIKDMDELPEPQEPTEQKDYEDDLLKATLNEAKRLADKIRKGKKKEKTKWLK